MRTTGRSLRLLALVVVTATMFVSFGGVAQASSWVVVLGPGSHGEVQAQALPTAPAGPAAACPAPTTTKKIKVTWTAVTHATAYSVYESITTVGGVYNLTAGGVYAGATWTSGALVTGTNYWFEVTASIGNNWVSVKSGATGESTINGANPFCVQP